MKTADEYAEEIKKSLESSYVEISKEWPLQLQRTFDYTIDRTVKDFKETVKALNAFPGSTFDNWEGIRAFEVPTTHLERSNEHKISIDDHTESIFWGTAYADYEFFVLWRKKK